LVPFGAFAKRDSPEGAKHEAHAHAKAAQNTQPRSIADKVRSYANSMHRRSPVGTDYAAKDFAEKLRSYKRKKPRVSGALILQRLRNTAP
jgi:hypothetical protein